MTLPNTVQTTVLPSELPDRERLKSLARALHDVHDRAKARMGEEDVTRVKRLNRFSRTMEVVGRVTLHFSFGPAMSRIVARCTS